MQLLQIWQGFMLSTIAWRTWSVSLFKINSLVYGQQGESREIVSSSQQLFKQPIHSLPSPTGCPGHDLHWYENFRESSNFYNKLVVSW